jgi:phenylalanyl-tRNA synthetase beta chain
VIGVLGVVKAGVSGAAGLQGRVAGAELDAAALRRWRPVEAGRGGVALTRFPGIERDLSLVVGESVAWSAIESAVAEASPPRLESLAYVGTYRGKQLGAGRKSVTLRLTFRDAEATLTHEAVDPWVEQVMAALRGGVGAELRA